MKKIINGKMYNTETAKAVGYYTNGKNPSDFSYVAKTLHMKRTGEYFLHVEGGPMTQYATHCGDNTRGYGYKIIPMTEQDARKWAKENLEADEYIGIFGEVEE